MTKKGGRYDKKGNFGMTFTKMSYLAKPIFSNPLPAMTKKGSVEPVDSEKLVILRNAVAMAKYDLSRNQQKVFLEVAMLAKNEPDAKFYRLYVREFLNNIGVVTNDTTELKREIEEMRNITIHIPLTKRGGELKANFFASVEIFENSRYIEIELADKLKPYFIEIAEGDFFHYQIQNTRVLKSSHSIRMYLYLKAWRWTGKATIRYNELRGILGIKEGDYKLFGDFKRRVLDKCQEELTAKTDVAFTYNLIRERANNPNTPVHKISFVIHDNGKTPAIIEIPLAAQMTLPLAVQPDEELLKLTHEIGPMDAAELATLIGSYGRERVVDVLLLVKDETAKGNRVRSLAAYLHNALKNNSGQGKARQHVQKRQQAEVVKTHRDIESMVKKGFDTYKTQYLITLGGNASQDQKDVFFARVQQKISQNRTLEKAYKKGDEWDQDALRAEMGVELLDKSDDELALLYMQSIGKPIEKQKGFWAYVRSE